MLFQFKLRTFVRYTQHFRQLLPLVLHNFFFDFFISRVRTQLKTNTRYSHKARTSERSLRIEDFPEKFKYEFIMLYNIYTCPFITIIAE